MLRRRCAKVELFRDQVRAPRRIDDPLGAVGRLRPIELDDHTMTAAVVRELELFDDGRDLHIDAELLVHLDEVGLEARAVELKRGNRRHVVDADLRHLREV